MSLNKEQQQFIAEQYHKLYKMLFIYANNIVKNRETAEDLVQKAFLAACKDKAIENFMSSANPRGWIVENLKYQIRNYIRSEQRSPEIISYDGDEILYNSELMGKNEEYFDLMYSDILSRDDLEIIKMVSIQGYKAKDVAEKLGISLDASNKRIERAKSRLRKALNDLEKI